MPAAAAGERVEAAVVFRLLFGEVDADGAAAPPILGVEAVDSSATTVCETVDGRLSASGPVWEEEPAVGTEAPADLSMAALAAASSTFSTELISGTAESAPPAPTRVVPSLALASVGTTDSDVTAAGFVPAIDSYPDVLVRLDAVEGL